MLLDVAEFKKPSNVTVVPRCTGIVPMYRRVLVWTCLLLGVVLTVFGILLICQGLGPGAITITCGGINFLIMALMVRIQPVKS